VAENKEEEAIGLEGARWFLHNVAKLFEPLMAKNKLYSYEYLRNVFAMELDPKDASDAELKEHHMVVVGNPDEVVRKLENFQRAGLSQVICFKQAGRIPHQNIMQSLKRMGKHVLPYFNPHRTIAVEDSRAAAL
jgi:alkanesulfonate monooxygenase SsuD/methylene tetrahydromethanopterin reductase-like flavin-dependent oxidoreductase (luciferase family)